MTSDSAVTTSGSPADKLLQSPASAEHRRSISDYFNPILVKEARQATSSQAFSTVMLVLIIALVLWTLGFTYFMYSRGITRDHSNALLLGYSVGLLVVMILVVPWMAFQSMMSEISTNTLQLVTMSTITPRQIVAGKLASVLAVTATYYSVIAPCVALAYLVGTLSILQVISFLATVLIASWLLSSACVFIAAARIESPSVIALGVLEVLACIFVGFYLWLWLAFQSFEGTIAWRWAHVEHPGVALSIAAVALAAAAVFNSASAAALMFRAANRSSALRIRLLILSAAWIALTIVLHLAFNRGIDMLLVMTIPFYIVWLIIGSFLVAERGEVSLRARRSLPDSRIARLPVGWLIPGNVTGYFFAVAVAWIYTFVLLGIAGPVTGGGVNIPQSLAFTLVVSAVYYTCYLAIARKLLQGLRRRYRKAGFATSLAVLATTLLAGHVVPYVLAAVFDVLPYETLQSGGFTSWPLVVSMFVDDISFRMIGRKELFYMSSAAGVFFLVAIGLHLREAAREIFVPSTQVPEAFELAIKEEEAVEEPRDPFDD